MQRKKGYYLQCHGKISMWEVKFNSTLYIAALGLAFIFISLSSTIGAAISLTQSVQDQPITSFKRHKNENEPELREMRRIYISMEYWVIE